MSDLKYTISADASAATQAVSGLQRTFLGLKTLIAGKFTAAAIASFVRSVVDMASELRNASDTLGVAINSLIGFQKIALSSGVATATLSQAMSVLRNAQGQVVKGNETLEKAFGTLGISAEAVVGLKLDELMVRIGQAFSESSSPTQAFSALCDIFGSRIGPGMVSALKEIGETGLPAIQRNGDTSAEAVEKLSHATDIAAESVNSLKLATANVLGFIAKLWVSTTTLIGDAIAGSIEDFKDLGQSIKNGFSGRGFDLKGLDERAIARSKASREAIADIWREKQPAPQISSEDAALEALRARKAQEAQLEQQKNDADAARNTKLKQDRIAGLREQLLATEPLNISKLGSGTLESLIASEKERADSLSFSRAFEPDEEKNLQIALQVKAIKKETAQMEEELSNRKHRDTLAAIDKAEKETEKKEQFSADIAERSQPDAQAPDRMARVGFYLGGDQVGIDYSRRTAKATEDAAKGIKRLETKIRDQSGSSATWTE